MSEPKQWQKKCDVCGEWTDGAKPICEHCGKVMEEERLQEKVKREEETDFDIAWVKIHPNDSIIVRFVKRTILTVQAIYFGFLSFFIWLIAMISS